QVAFHLGPLPVHWFGVFVATGFLTGLWTASRRARRDGLGDQVVYDLGPWLILGALAGARALYVISYWKEEFAGQPWTDMFMIQRGGIVFYGGLIGAVACGITHALLKKLPMWKLA